MSAADPVMGTLKLFTLPECLEFRDKGHAGPWRDAAVKALSSVWEDDELCCVLCGEPLGRVVSYAAVIVPNDEHFVPQCLTAGVCLPCGVGQPRAAVHKAALVSAMMMLGEVGGHA